MQYEHKRIAERLKIERDKLKLSQDALAELLNVNRNTIRRWERQDGKGQVPPLNDLLRMCNIFDCELGYLLCEHTCKTREATNVQEVTGLSEYTINQLKEYRAYSNALDFDLIDFIDYLVQTVDTRLPMRINALLQIPRYKTTVEESEREERIYAEIYSDIKAMVNDIRKRSEEHKIYKEKMRKLREKSHKALKAGGDCYGGKN